MSQVHFLNVNDGDCSWIKHADGKITVIDVNKASLIKVSLEETRFAANTILGNFNQKHHPVNPIEYLKRHGVTSVFRFILTHPDMDHMGGIKDFFKTFEPVNFWDTANNKIIGSFGGSPYSEDDWKFYQSIRSSDTDPKTLNLYSGAKGQYFNQNEDKTNAGNGLYVLAPTPQLMKEANESEDHNGGSYVILYRSANHKILFCGDSHDKAWEHILANHCAEVKDVDLMIAPHHGRESDRKYDFLDVTKPKLTFFGNANSEHLAYEPWRYRKLEYITNNQANCLVADSQDAGLSIFSTYETFAKTYNPSTKYSPEHQAWYLKTVQ